MITLKEAYLKESSSVVEEVKRYIKRSIFSGPDVVDFVKGYARLYALLDNFGAPDFEYAEGLFRKDENIPTFFKFILRKFKNQLTSGELSWEDVPTPNEIKDISLETLKANLKPEKERSKASPDDYKVDPVKFASDMEKGKYGKLD